MTDFEIEYVQKYIAYLKTTYKINISQEDFVHDIDVSSMVNDAAIAGVNYQNVYKKYLKLVASAAYLTYFSMSDIAGDEKSFKKTVGGILSFYEIMMISILKSSVFGEYNKLPIAETLFAGMNQRKFAEQITPDLLPKTCVDEFKNKYPVLDCNKLSDLLLIKMHDYKNTNNKELVFKRISIIYSALMAESKRLGLAKKIELKSVLKRFRKEMSLILDISSKELVNRIKNSSNEVGNYTNSVNIVVDAFKTGNFFKTFRNMYEEKEEDLEQIVKEFENNVMNNQEVVVKMPNFNDDIFSEGGNANA